MGIRHKAIKETLEVGTSGEWNDDHTPDFTDEIVIYENLINGDITEKWDRVSTGGAELPAVTFSDHHAFILLDTNSGAGDTSVMTYHLGINPGNITHTNDAPVMNIAVWLEAYAATGKVAEFGLFNNTVDLFTANQDGAYFRVNANKLYAVCGDGAAETATDITPIGGISEYAAYKIELGSANCKFYVENMETPARIETSNLPDADLTMAVGARNDGGTDTLIYVDAVALKRNRYKG